MNTGFRVLERHGGILRWPKKIEPLPNSVQTKLASTENTHMVSTTRNFQRAIFGFDDMSAANIKKKNMLMNLTACMQPAAHASIRLDHNPEQSGN